jgi:hypothetical protein
VTQLLGSIPATSIRNLAIRNLVVSASAATILLTVATGASGSPDAVSRTYSTTVYSTAAGPAVSANDATTADVDPRTGLAQYSEVAENSGGALGDYLKTIENMEPALKATAGDFARQTAALDSAHTAMVAAALRKDDEPDVEEQGRSAIRGANEAINAQGKADEYTANLDRTGAFERQWGRKRAQQPAAAPGSDAAAQM